MEKYDLIIIGAGAAGLYSAACAPPDLRVLVLEKSPSPGRKLLLTGGGRCNLAHSGEPGELIDHYGWNGRFLRKAFHRFGIEQLTVLMARCGVKLYEDDSGRFYPVGDRAADVLSALLSLAGSSGVVIRCSMKVTGISEESEGFSVVTQDGAFSAGSVLITTGGRSYTITGSSGDGYDFAARLGHNIVPQRPALVPIHLQNHPFRGLPGIAFKGSICVPVPAGGTQCCRGEFLVTDKGLSGPAMLNISRHVLQGTVLKLELLGRDDFAVFQESVTAPGMKPELKTVLSRFLPGRLAASVLAMADCPPGLRAAETSRSRLEALHSLLTGMELTALGTGGYNEAFVTAGGIDLRQVNPATMESLLVPGVYFAGEVLDIDGDCGGYNLLAAFATASAAVSSIAKP
ncbi:MAG: NAD(P)/FAD-dependent oxidoreductase [Candidatus Wallbacteria bacterium]|nr:NAD(P)/FAD-dependent oxidoreductase [Candidatus Wallbacteria bacterium]